MERKPAKRAVYRLGAQTLHLDEIASEELDGKELIGTAYGMDIAHCIYLGRKHVKEFSRAKYYRINPEEDDHLRKRRETHPHHIRVEFYA